MKLTVEETAKYLYFKHMKTISPACIDMMWKQCTEEYRNAWRTIASGGDS